MYNSIDSFHSSIDSVSLYILQWIEKPYYQYRARIASSIKVYIDYIVVFCFKRKIRGRHAPPRGD